MVTHVIGIHRHFLSVLDGTPEPSGDPGDVVAAWTAVRSDVETALADPDRAGRVVETPFGTIPFEVLVGRFVSVDLLVHTWDLSRATGLDERINADAVGHAYEGLKPMDAMLRGQGMFEDKVTPPAGADLQTEFLCFLGRDAAPLLLNKSPDGARAAHRAARYHSMPNSLAHSDNRHSLTALDNDHTRSGAMLHGRSVVRRDWRQ